MVGKMAAGWSVTQVNAWLASVRHNSAPLDDSVLHAFETNAIDGAALLELTSAELRDDLGVSQLGVRQTILREIRNLVDGAAPEGEPPTAERRRSEEARRRVQERIGDARETRDLAIFDEVIAALEAALAIDPTNNRAQDDLELVRMDKGLLEMVRRSEGRLTLQRFAQLTRSAVRKPSHLFCLLDHKPKRVGMLA